VPDPDPDPDPGMILSLSFSLSRAMSAAVSLRPGTPAFWSAFGGPASRISVVARGLIERTATTLIARRRPLSPFESRTGTRVPEVAPLDVFLRANGA